MAHRAYVMFLDSFGWQCQFLEADLKTPLPRKLRFTSPDKLRELVERGGGFKDQEARLMLEAGVDQGRGGVFLDLPQGTVQEAEHYFLWALRVIKSHQWK